MIIINSVANATKLNKGDQYIIGFNFNSPESMDIKKMEQIQKFIDNKFNTEK
jgi:hypothetical protein